MNVSEIFTLWRDAAGDPPDRSWDRDDIYGFFQRFRPRADGLERALLPLPHGRAVLDRMLPIYSATSDGWQTDDYSDAYFVVRNPAPIDTSEAGALVRDHLRNVGRAAALAKVGELVELLREPALSFSFESPPRTPDRHDTDVFIYDTLCDWVRSLTADPPEITALRDAFYSIACDYFLAWHVTWPWFATATTMVEPFHPYFRLWQHGVEYRFDGASSATVYLPRPR